MSMLESVVLSPRSQLFQSFVEHTAQKEKLEASLLAFFEEHSCKADDPECLSQITHIHHEMAEATRKADVIAQKLVECENLEAQERGKQYLIYRLQTKKYEHTDAQTACKLLRIKSLENQITAHFKNCISDRGSILSKDPLDQIKNLQERILDATKSFGDHPELASLNYAIWLQLKEINQPRLPRTPTLDPNNMALTLQKLLVLKTDIERKKSEGEDVDDEEVELYAFFARMIDVQHLRKEALRDGNCCIHAILQFLRTISHVIYGLWNTPEEEKKLADQLRSQIANHIEEHQDDFQGCHISPRDGSSSVSLDEYVNEIRTSGHHFDNAEIRALADLLKISIYVYTLGGVEVVDNKIVPIASGWIYHPQGENPEPPLPVVHLFHNEKEKHWCLLAPRPIEVRNPPSSPA